MRDCLRELKDILKAKIECIWITTYEETDVITDIKETILSNFPNYKLRLWSCSEGLTEVPLVKSNNPPEDKKVVENTQTLFKIIKSTTFGAESYSGSNNIYILRDFDKLLNPDNIRRIRDLKEPYLKEFYCSQKQNQYFYNPIIIISTTSNIPSDISKLFYTIDYKLPNKEEVSSQVDKAYRILKKQHSVDANYIIPKDKEIPSIINACIGLTRNEINMVLKESLTKYHTLDLNFISNSKIQAVKKSGALDYRIPKYTLDDIGGNNALKDWLFEVKDLFTDEATEFGLTKPKGYMSVGIPGCGKTALAEAFAGTMKVPLLILSINRIMNRMVGESEKKIVQALQVAKACAPCVLLLDEVEKVLGGVNSSNNSDSGITSRVFQEILKFMNDNDSGVYVIMTSNDVSQLPPEFTRAGRLDATWYFGLPKEEERREIFKIHFSKYKQNISDELLNTAVAYSEHFTGAEIEETVKNCMRKAFVKYKQTGEKDVTAKEIIAATKEVIPVYESSKEKILILETYCKGRARRTDYETNKKNIEVISSSNNEEDDIAFW